MSEYGYIPEAPEQSFGNNKGIFTPKDIYDLTRADKWKQLGQLVLLETQTVSGVSSVIFDDIQQDIYNVHFLTTNNVTVTTNAADLYIRFFENGVEESGSVYDYAYQACSSSGSFVESRSTSSTFLRFHWGMGTPAHEVGNGYSYLYNLGDSNKFSYQTAHWTQVDSGANYASGFGNGMLQQASTVDQIKVYPEAGNISATMSLYGIRYS